MNIAPEILPFFQKSHESESDPVPRHLARIKSARAWARKSQTQNEIFMTNLILSELGEQPVLLGDPVSRLTLSSGVIVGVFFTTVVMGFLGLVGWKTLL